MILFSIEHWLSKERRETSPHYYCSVGAWRALGGQCAVIPYDDPMDEKRDERLARAVEETKPSMVVATALVQLGGGNINPATYRHIRDTLKVPVVMLWLESAPDVVRFADIYAPHISKGVFVDTREHWRRFTQYQSCYEWLPEPKDTRMFYRRDFPRSWNVSFIGSVVGRADRAFNVAQLKANGIDVYETGGSSYRRLTLSQYADELCRSFMTLNFTSAITFHHINGRTSESLLCGAILLESQNEETPNLLDPFRHYVPFVEPFRIDERTGQIVMQGGDLVDKARYYIGKGRQEAEKIARQGHERAMEVFDGRKFWKGIHKLVGVDWRLQD